MSGLLIPDPLNIGIYPDPLSKGIYVAGGIAPTFFRDDFDRSDRPLDGDWVGVDIEDYEIVNEQLVNTAVGQPIRFEHDLLTPDHYAAQRIMSTSEFAYVCTRMQGGVIASDVNFYGAHFNPVAERWRIVKVTSLTPVTVGQSAIDDSTLAPYEIKLVATNVAANVQLQLYKDDILQASFTDSSSPFTTGNYTGTWFAQVPRAIDYFEAGSL